MSVSARGSPLGRVATHDGRGSAPDTNGSGLRGLSERLAAAGGTVQAGPLEPGGFRLAVQLPR